MTKSDYIPTFKHSGTPFESEDPNCPFYKDCEPHFGILCVHPDAPDHHTKRIACRPEYCALLGKTKATFSTDRQSTCNELDKPSLTDPHVKAELYKLITG